MQEGVGVEGYWLDGNALKSIWIIESLWLKHLIDSYSKPIVTWTLNVSSSIGSFRQPIFEFQTIPLAIHTESSSIANNVKQTNFPARSQRKLHSHIPTTHSLVLSCKSSKHYTSNIKRLFFIALSKFDLMPVHRFP